MNYDQRPLFPPMRPICDTDSCVKMKVFGSERCGCPCPPQSCCQQKVFIENPCRPGECAEVLLGVDECGSLTICVHRDAGWNGGCKPGRRPPRRPRDCGCDSCSFYR